MSYRHAFIDFDDLLTETMVTMAGGERAEQTNACPQVQPDSRPVVKPVRRLGPAIRLPIDWGSVDITTEMQGLANAIHDNSVARRRMARRAA